MILKEVIKTRTKFKQLSEACGNIYFGFMRDIEKDFKEFAVIKQRLKINGQTYILYARIKKDK